MDRTKFLKWRITAVAIACVVAYFLPDDDDDDIAKIPHTTPKCAAANKASKAGKLPDTAELRIEDECSLVRNAVPHAQA